MSKTLKDLVTLKTDNDECTILEVNEGAYLDLIALGCFNGQEKYLRITKGRNLTCTIFNEDKTSFSWNWGPSGYTLVTDATRAKGLLITTCIKEDFGINLS